jgi:glycine cleavage system H protein
MSQIPADRSYGPNHEWVKADEDGLLTLGVTDHGQSLLGDLVYVQMPRPGDAVKAGEPCVVVESVKAASDVLSPVDGEVVEVNDSVVDEPQRVNDAPMTDGWLLRIRPAAAMHEWMDADAYAASIG